MHTPLLHFLAKDSAKNTVFSTKCYRSRGQPNAICMTRHRPDRKENNKMQQLRFQGFSLPHILRRREMLCERGCVLNSCEKKCNSRKSITTNTFICLCAETKIIFVHDFQNSSLGKRLDPSNTSSATN